MFNVLESDRNADERKINNSNERKKKKINRKKRNVESNFKWE